APMVPDLWWYFLAPVLFGALIGCLSVLLFLRYLERGAWARFFTSFGFLIGNGGLLYAGVTVFERVLTPESREDLMKLAVSYLGGAGLAGFLTIYARWPQSLDLAFLDIFSPLREELAPNEIRVLQVMIAGKRPSALARWWGWLTRNPPEPQRPDPAQAAAS